MNQQPERSKIRKSQRAQDDLWIRDFLHKAPYGTLATEAGGQPYLVARNFIYDEDTHALYLHGAKAGRTFQNLMHNPRVCFSVSEMGRLISAGKACSFSVEYRSVVLFGRAEIISQPGQIRHALQLLLKKYAPHLEPGKDYQPLTEDNLATVAVIRIDIDAWSGKARHANDEEENRTFLFPIATKTHKD